MNNTYHFCIKVLIQVTSSFEGILYYHEMMWKFDFARIFFYGYIFRYIGLCMCLLLFAYVSVYCVGMC